MRRLSEVSAEEIKDFLGKGWLTHDGMWFYHTFLDAGMDKANRINREAIRSLAAVEMSRARKVLRATDEDLRDFKGVRGFMQDALEMILPESVLSRAEFTFIPPNTFHWEWREGECFAYRAMRQLGVIDDYMCGVMFRIECWLEHLGIPYRMEPKIEKCIMHGNGNCRGDFIIDFGGASLPPEDLS